MPFIDHVLNAVAQDRHHVAVIRHIAGIAQAPVARNHHGAALRPEFRNRDLQNLIQPVEHPVDRSTLRHVDHRIRIGAQNVARRDHIGIAEKHHAVAIGMRRRHMHDPHAFVIEKFAQLVAVRVIRVGGLRIHGAGFLAGPAARSCASARSHARSPSRPALCPPEETSRPRSSNPPEAATVFRCRRCDPHPRWY